MKQQGIPPGSIESGSWDAVLAHDSVAVVAHYSDRPDADRSLEALLRNARAAGFGTVLVSTSEVREPLRFSNPEASPHLVIRRPNVGYDFGSWASVICGRPEVAGRRTLLLNNSLAGPFEPITALLDRARFSATDIWGLIGSAQFTWHIQSYCIGFAPGVLADPAVQRFWRSVAPQPTKQDVIMKFELGQSQMLLAEGFTFDVVVPPGLLIDKGSNPAILAWRRLLDYGIPFVKKELIRDPSVAPDADEIPAELRRRFDIDVEEWV